MKTYLLRHTRPDISKGICYGQTDVDVLPSFIEEKNAVLEKIKDIKFDKIFSSPLKRCSMLASALNGENDVQVSFDKRLMELNFGSWEGKYWRDIENMPEAKQWFDDYLNIRCPGGESYHDLLMRVQSFIDDLRKTDDNKKILIVCHSGTIRAFYVILNQLRPDKAFELNIDYGDFLGL